MKTTAGSEAICPGCREKFEMKLNTRLGDWVECPHCEADLEVSNLCPVTLDWAYEGPEIAGRTKFWWPHSKWSNW